MENDPRKLEKKGNDALKKSIFKWKKDYVGAATYYDQAAKVYKNKQDYDNVL